ncbi:MAG: roadblock/LC7 domain-containing protein [Blastocatellia bacterium]
MRFKEILRDLVSNVDGASGAIFLDCDGEAVDWYSWEDGDRLKLRAAYLAVLVQTCRSTADRLGLGFISNLVVEYDGAQCLIEEIESGYFFLLEMSFSANLAQAQRFVGPAVESLRQEIAA